ncbi:MAG: peptidase M28 family protein, partial [Bacteroidetes bacterium]|nr:peptidase M28 family protein [Bacteroidota bacterium]
MRYYLPVLLICFSASMAFGQNEDSVMIRRIADEILVNGKAYDNLRELTKGVGGRLSGSPQMYKAEAWGKKTLEASGADRVWMQQCMVPHWLRGGKDEVVAVWAKINKKPLDVIALG